MTRRAPRRRPTYLTGGGASPLTLLFLPCVKSVPVRPILLPLPRRSISAPANSVQTFNRGSLRIRFQFVARKFLSSKVNEDAATPFSFRCCEYKYDKTFVTFGAVNIHLLEALRGTDIFCLGQSTLRYINTRGVVFNLTSEPHMYLFPHLQHRSFEWQLDISNPANRPKTCLAS